MNEFLHRHRIGLTIFVLVLLFLYVQQPARDVVQMHQFGGGTMGTTYNVKVVDEREQASSELLALEIGELLRHLDRDLMSTYSEDSELSEINKAAVGENLSISREMADVLNLALEINTLTDGAFDVTVGPLVNRWGFGPERRRSDRIPSQAEIDALLSRVGSQYLELDTDALTLRKNADVYIDLSGIAKGYAVDQLAHYLDGRGFGSYFIEVGGELRIRGYKPGDESWVPAIEKPVDTAPQVHNIFYTRGQPLAVAGSGDYRNYFDQDGVHYSHEIDPLNGRPVTHNLAATYVIDAEAARADALATAFMVMGTDRAFALAERIGLAAYFISKRPDGAGFDDRYTRAFADYLQAD